MVPSNLLTPTDDDFDRFEERLLHTVETQLVQRRRRHRGIVAAATALLVAGGGVTAWVTLATPELRSLSTYCYSEASTDSAFTQVGSPTDRIADDGTATSLPPVADPAAAAVSNCQAVWAIDFFGPAAPTSPAPPAPTVPALQACLRPDGVYAVFPVLPGAETADDPDAFCAAVGLQPPYAP
ncbi:hypothetical protein [Cryobacterium arcticum]|uniref:Uncharacterized protein n=1 Tax=Cryobacterium arcticum TaxID=670052 RepID=A0A317ZSK1_9MICO|nr:hypothetical protein [Cryobacterium arcticum]PXA67735.1 hypothetical protein CTB96_13635 [Cryobacterium arcticum]